MSQTVLDFMMFYAEKGKSFSSNVSPLWSVGITDLECPTRDSDMSTGKEGTLDPWNEKRQWENLGRSSSRGLGTRKT